MAAYLSRRKGNDAWRRCGGLGTLSAFSFYANKLVTTGEGGMVLTDSDALAERCRRLRNLYFEIRVGSITRNSVTILEFLTFRPQLVLPK